MSASTPLTAEQRANLHDSARRLAQQLRRAAIADFWQGVHRLAAHALRALGRANTAAPRKPEATISHNPTGV